MKMQVNMRFKIITISLLFTSAVVFANLPDMGKNLTINSDTFHFDNQTGIATYTGNVVAVQGNRHLTGDRIEIHRDEKTGKMDNIIVHGNPAYYAGPVEPGKPPVNAQANLITYHIPTKFLTLTGNAQVEQEGDVYRSYQIEYDGIKDTVYSPPSAEGQTTIIIKDIEDAGI